tara:strand:+ start:4601 stop:4774 length:174 start_codon:yes stop_codon:yes gene_type:complete
MNEQEICDLLRYGIVYARHTINDLKHHKAFGDEHEKAISVMEQFIERCQQIINQHTV